tara:strand:- start:384 stop:503 length:120 start_codon:yes stop_codon:yes gene_type:complete
VKGLWLVLVRQQGLLQVERRQLLVPLEKLLVQRKELLLQ